MAPLEIHQCPQIKECLSQVTIFISRKDETDRGKKERNCKKELETKQKSFYSKKTE